MIRQLSYGIRRSILCWTSAGDVGLPPRKRWRPVVAGLLPSRGSPALRAATIGRGLSELRGEAEPEAAPGRVRRKGAGRPALVDADPTLLGDLAALVEPTTRGDPMAPLRWTAKSLRNLAVELGGLGHRISHNVVADLLRHLGYSLQANRKTREGTEHPDRDAQFGYINRKVKQALAANEPAISVDTKKKGALPLRFPSLQ